MTPEQQADAVRRDMGALAEHSHRGADLQVNRVIIGTALELLLALGIANDYAHDGIKLEHGVWYVLASVGLGIEFFDRVRHRYRYQKEVARSQEKRAGDYA